MVFHEQQEFVYDFPSQSLAMCASVGVSELFFSTRGFATLAQKLILTRPLRHVWPKIVMGNHTHTLAVHKKSHSFATIVPGKDLSKKNYACFFPHVSMQ